STELPIGPGNDRRITLVHETDRLEEQCARLLRTAPKTLETSQLVERAGEVFRVPCLLERSSREVEVGTRIVEPSLARVDVAQGQVRVRGLRSQVELTVRIFCPVERAFCLLHPPLRNMQPSDVKIHLRNAHRVLDPRFQSIEQASRFGG